MKKISQRTLDIYLQKHGILEELATKAPIEEIKKFYVAGSRLGNIITLNINIARISSVKMTMNTPIVVKCHLKYITCIITGIDMLLNRIMVIPCNADGFGDVDYEEVEVYFPTF